MQLKSLEMQGFKSFPDKTKINVCPGMTVVVGPNGSGKSNIADAIRWVLGELSSKNIRGTKMEDVIFGGCDSRKPMGFAEVSLIFDNTKGEIPLPVSYDEVCITRKYYRSGISEYMINRKPVRLKDITDLFMNTGLGKSGYSIIGQGRIAEIISKKSEDRRGIFEEAAGISRYRSKKNEAERKLTDVNLNLSTVEILRNTLEEQLGPLEKQSIKAKKYMGLRDEKMKLDIAIWLYEIDTVRERAAELNSKCEMAQHEYDIALDDVASLESKHEALLENSRRSAELLEANRTEIRECTELKHRYENQCSVMQSEITHIDSDIKRLKNELEEIRANGLSGTDLIDKLTATLRKAEAELEKLNNKYFEYEQNLQEARILISNADKDIELTEDDIDRISNELLEEKLNYSKLDTSNDGDTEKKEQLTLEIANERKKLIDGSNNEQRVLDLLTTHEQKLAILETDIKSKQTDKDKLLDKKTTLNERKSSCLINASSIEQRKETLKRMEEHFEGFGAGVRLIMDWSGKGLLDGICGPVSKLITLDTKHSIAIESALGGAVQNIVCEDDRSAKSAIAKLKAERGGIVTFYPISTMRPTKLNIDLDTLKQCKGYIGFANELVDFQPKYAPVIDYLLCRTLVCTDLDAASEIGKKFDYRFRIVTLDGQIINAGGSFTGGSQKTSSGILTRRSEILSLEAKIAEIKNEVTAIDIEISKVNSELLDIDGKISEVESDIEIASALLQNSKMELELIRGRNGDTKDNIFKLENDLLELSNKELEFKQKIINSENKIDELSSLLDEKKAILAELKNKRAELETLRSSIIDNKNLVNTQIGVSRSKIEYTKRELSTATENTLSLATKEKNNNEQISELENTKKSLLISVKDNAKLANELAFKITELDESAKELRKNADNIEKEAAILKGEIKVKQTHADNCFQSLTRFKERSELINTEQDKYISLLWDEYDLTYQMASDMPHDIITVDNKPQAITAQSKLKRQMKELGDVNLASIDEFATTKQKFEELDKQFQDLIKSRDDYMEIVKNMERKMKTLFSDTFDRINENFSIVFKELFGGGRAELTLTDKENILESGIEISVAPPGKIIKNLSLLSGGEQVFVAIALFFAILRVNPAPFCLLDEIEAALDEVNVIRFAEYAKKYADKTQFIIISHRRGTMEKADTLYGVTMQQRGISTVLSIEVNEVERKLGLKDLK